MDAASNEATASPQDHKPTMTRFAIVKCEETEIAQFERRKRALVHWGGCDELLEFRLQAMRSPNPAGFEGNSRK